MQRLLFLILLLANQASAQTNGLSNIEFNNPEADSRFLFCDTIFSFHVEDTWPTGIAWDGRHLWSGGSEDPLIYKYTLAGTIAGSIPNPNNVYGTQGLVFDGQDLWALSEETNLIFKLDTSNGNILKQFHVPLSFEGFGLAFDGTHLWATDYVNKYLVKLDTSTGAVLQLTSLEKPVLDIKFINNKLYGLTTLADATLYQIDPTNGKSLDSLDWCIPYPLGITWDGTHLWNISSKINFGGKQRAYKIDLGSFVSTEQPFTKQEYLLDVFPNPANESLQVQVSDNMLGLTYSLVDPHGRVLLSGRLEHQNTVLDINNIPAGAYFFKVGVASARLVTIMK